MSAVPQVPDEASGQRSRTVTWTDPTPDFALMKRVGGLEYLQHLLATRKISAPIASVLDFYPTCFEHGRAVFEGNPAECHYNPIGSVHGGYAATLLDSALGCAVQTVLPAGQAYTTVELKVNYVKALRADTGPVTAEAKIIAAGSRIATAEARLTDRSGRLYAHGSTTCLIFPL